MIPIPLRDENPTHRFPLVTVALIVINVVAWFFELMHPHGVTGAVLDYGALPAWILSHQREGDLILGEAPAAISVHLFQEVPWPFTIITSMFMHAGWMHIIGNLWFLWIFGDNLEDLMGKARFLVFYLLSGVIAAFAHILTTTSGEVPMVGASGAIAGVLGGYALSFPRARIHCLWILIVFVTTVEVPAVILLGLWLVSQFLLPQGGVAWMAHVGGFLAGLGLVRLFARSRPLRPRRIEVLN